MKPWDKFKHTPEVNIFWDALYNSDTSPEDYDKIHEAARRMAEAAYLKGVEDSIAHMKGIKDITS